ncbi:dihydroneopterin aldolase [Brooklawnia sp.]|uniref:dihydroneopterin aldolase n=1 Tax=Brooklawnia sp. TaxID=2699740 RepID=UPI00311DD943
MDKERLATITLTGLRGWGYHGVLASERARGQEFIVDLEIELDIPTDDDIGATVDYGALATKVAGIVEGEAVNLIETLASAIASSVLEGERIRSTTVTVHKPHAPIAVPFSDVAVTISRRKHA